MGQLRYFADLPDGETVSFERVDNRNQSTRYNDTWGWNGTAWVRVTRVVEFKSSPSRHECDDRCLQATGRTMKCECACGGKNHGRAAFTCIAA
jgi:hypothetical protein